ncbi:MAG: hypothetical protein H0V82_09550 [Candidatus Protochlamydia sp.]|nr:hypothetical protein [Candidatus Protochlamydia sp.]
MKGIYLILKRPDSFQHVWFTLSKAGEEKATSVWGGTPQEAIQAARKIWREGPFQTINCGFRYTLPERDQHGANALFCQMAASYSSPTGVYFEEELGANCIVQNASLEARDLYKRLIK